MNTASKPVVIEAADRHIKAAQAWHAALANVAECEAALAKANAQLCESAVRIEAALRDFQAAVNQ